MTHPDADHYNNLPNVLTDDIEVGPVLLVEDNDRGTVVLFTPRVWANLNQSRREHPAAIEARYMFDTVELDAVGAEFGWQRPGAHFQQTSKGS